MREIYTLITKVLRKLSGKTINYTYDAEQAENGVLRYFFRDLNRFKPWKVSSSYDFKVVSAFEVFGEYLVDHFDLREMEGHFFYSSYKLQVKA